MKAELPRNILLDSVTRPNTEHDVSTLGHFWLLKRNYETEQVTASREHINITCGDMLNLMEHSVKYVQYELSGNWVTR